MTQADGESVATDIQRVELGGVLLSILKCAGYPPQHPPTAMAIVLQLGNPVVGQRGLGQKEKGKHGLVLKNTQGVPNTHPIGGWGELGCVVGISCFLSGVYKLYRAVSQKN